VLERLLSGDAVGRELGVRERYDSNPILSQVAERARLAIAPEEADATDGIDPDRPGVQFTRRSQLVDVGRVSGKKDIVWSAIFDLLAQDRAGSDDEADGLAMGEWLLKIREVGGGGNSEDGLGGSGAGENEQTT